jgi:hypothetical protein
VIAELVRFLVAIALTATGIGFLFLPWRFA